MNLGSNKVYLYSEGILREVVFGSGEEPSIISEVSDEASDTESE